MTLESRIKKLEGLTSSVSSLSDEELNSEINRLSRIAKASPCPHCPDCTTPSECQELHKRIDAVNERLNLIS